MPLQDSAGGRHNLRKKKNGVKVFFVFMEAIRVFCEKELL